jgi:hypothetical protein
MNFRLTAALFAGVLALVVALLVASLSDEEALRTDGGLVPALALTGVKEKDIDTVELVRTKPAEERLVFTRPAGGKWAMKEPHPAKVDSFAVDRVVGDLFGAKPVSHPELTTNPANHGLDPAPVKITLKAGDKSATVDLGDTSRGGDRAVTFAVTSDAPGRPVAVRRSDLSGLFKDAKTDPGDPAKAVKWLADLRSRRPLGDDVRDPAADLAGFKLTAGGKELALTHKPNGPWVFAAPVGFGEADTNGASEAASDVYTGVRPLLTALSNLNATGGDDFVEKPGDLAQYGLSPGNPAAVRVEFTPSKGDPEGLTLGGPVLADGKPVLPAKVYAQVQGDPAVVKLTTDRVEAIKTTVARPGELRNKDLFAETLKDQIDALDVTSGGTTAKLRKVTIGTGKKWLLYGGPGDPQEANQPAVDALVAALTKPRQAKDVLTAPYDAAFSPAEQKVTIKAWANGVTAKADGDKLPAEPAPTGTPSELTFGLKEPAGVLVRRVVNGEKTDLRVPESVLASAAKGRLDFLDAKLKTFPPADATKLILKRPAGPVEVTKDGAKWTFAGSGKPADAARADGLVGVLAGLFPAKVLAEQPAPDDLKKLGLDAPRLVATVGLKAGDATYEFGGETADKLYVAAREAGKPLVVAVPRVVADRLLTEDLRDRTLYTIDPAQAVGLKVRGWKGPAGVQTLEFEKKDKDWVAKSPAGYAADPAKVTGLLAALALPRAEEFVGLGKVEYGLDPAANDQAVEFTVVFPAPTPAVTLVLGGKAGGDRVYAATSAVPGEAVTFDPVALRPFVEKQTSLAK